MQTFGFIPKLAEEIAKYGTPRGCYNGSRFDTSVGGGLAAHQHGADQWKTGSGFRG